MTNRAIAVLAVLAALGALVAAALAVLLWAVLRPAPVTPAAPPPAVSATATPSPSGYNPSAGDAGDNPTDAPAETQQAAWGPVADRFARNFTNTRGGAEKWRKRLAGDPSRPDVTTAVAKQLATVDIRNVPDGRYDGREVLKSSDYDLAVKVIYDTGLAMVLYMITDGTNWQIYAYDKWEP